MLNSNIFVISCSISLRWLVCGFLAGPPHHTKSKEGLVVSNKGIENGIMDETKSQEIESLKEQNFRQRQQMMEMYRAWASGLPPPPFPTFVPANTLSLPPKSQSQFLTVVDTSQHAVDFISRQMHSNASASHYLAPQYKSTTFIAPHTVCAFIAQPSTEAFTLPINPTVVLPQSASGPMFKALDDHCYTLEPIVKLRGMPKFLTKKPSKLEKSEKMMGKVKSVENDIESFLGLMGKEDVSYKDWGMSSSISLLQSFEISKFEKHDGQKDSVKLFGRYCNQSRETEEKKKGNTPIVVPGPKQSLRGPNHQYYQPQSRAYISNPLTDLQQGSSFQNSRSFILLPQCPLNNAQFLTHPSCYPQWYAPVPQPPQIY
ncbi:hypothetical protein P3L10_012624 [Capsicum annuum]